MFYYILLAIWILVIPTIIILSRKELENNVRLFIVQLYNFIIGLSAPIIHLIIVFCILMIFNDSGWDSIIDKLFYKVYAIGMGVIFALLLVSMNKYMKKKINMNAIYYTLLSIMNIGLGILTFFLVDKMSSIL